MLYKDPWTSYQQSIHLNMAAQSQRALGRGSSLPPLTKGVLRLYSMRFCPYAQRTRMVLVHKNIPHETVNVNLKYKPKWMFERNPVGLVPVLEKDSKVVFESAACDDYLDELYPQNKLTPSDPYVKARHRALMDMFSTVVGYFYGILRGSPEEKVKVFRRLQRFLQNYEKALQGKYFGGDEPAMVDFHIWPWFERMEVIKKHGQDPMPPEKFPKLNAWVKTMMERPEVRDTYFEPHFHEQFFTSLLAGNPNYDIGLTANM